MATKTFNTRVANKRDTSSNWTTNNPVLLNGEIIIVDTEAGQVRYKVGNGTSTYTQLPFTDENLITNINGKLSLSGGTMTGNINMGGHKLTDLGAPVNSNDAVRQADLKVVSDEVDGIIAGTTAITLPIADDTKLGGVKIGEGVNVAEDGTISVKPGLPDGGTEGQMLYKSADGAAWGDKPVMWVKVTQNGNAADKTLSEIYQAYQNGYVVYCNLVNWGFLPMSSINSTRAVFFSTYNVGSGPDDIAGINADLVVIEDSGVSITTNFALSSIFLEIPSGGTTGQVLTKTSTGEEWSDAPSGLPEGGTEGQILKRGASGAEWDDAEWLPLSGGTVSGDITIAGAQRDLHFTSLSQSIYWDAIKNENDKIAYLSANYLSDEPVILLGFKDENTGGIEPIRLFGLLTPIEGNDAANKYYVDNQLSTKLTTPTGTQGQLLGFTADNTVGAVDAPESGLTQSEADERYLQLSGGTLTGRLTTPELWGKSPDSSFPFFSMDASSGSINIPMVYTREPIDSQEIANKAYVDSKAPTSVVIDLPASGGWSDGTCTVNVNGVLANQSAQLITPVPSTTYQKDYYNAGIICTGQAENSLTFTAKNPDSLPSTKFTVYVVIQPLS